MEETGTAGTIRARVPLPEMSGDATSVRSATQGRASVTMQFEHYAAVVKSTSGGTEARVGAAGCGLWGAGVPTTSHVPTPASAVPVGSGMGLRQPSADEGLPDGGIRIPPS